jgi:uncharacterized protein (DUF427 family)
MSLTSGTGPLSGRRAGRFTAPVPDGVAYVEPFPRRVRGVVGGRTVVDTERALLVHRPGGPPVWAFPTAEVTGGAVPSSPVAEAEGHVEVPWAAVDTWLQEEEEVLLHAPNPYHRVEYMRTARRVRASVGGTVLVDAVAAVAVYETALPPRLYVARDDVLAGALVPSPTTSVCPYKGVASWWTVRVGDVETADAAWSYEKPTPEAARIAGLLCFDGARLTVTDDLPTPA